eukprot:4019217-Amphidinium_carterae.2
MARGSARALIVLALGALFLGEVPLSRAHWQMGGQSERGCVVALRGVQGVCHGASERCHAEGLVTAFRVASALIQSFPLAAIRGQCDVRAPPFEGLAAARHDGLSQRFMPFVRNVRKATVESMSIASLLALAADTSQLQLTDTTLCRVDQMIPALRVGLFRSPSLLKSRAAC